MDEQVPVYVDLSPDIQELLIDNGVSLRELLQQHGIQVQQELAPDPVQTPGSSTRDPVTILLATGGLILTLTPAIRQAISALSNRPVVVKEMICVPVEDSGGNVVRDRSGNPILHWVERTTIDRPEVNSQANNTIKIKGPLGLHFSYSDLPVADKEA